jgi:hypothetical protein
MQSRSQYRSVLGPSSRRARSWTHCEPSPSKTRNPFFINPRIPIYSFVEDYAIGSGYNMLLAGKEISLNPFSIVGSIGRSYKSLALSKLCKKLGITYENFTTRNFCRIN